MASPVSLISTALALAYVGYNQYKQRQFRWWPIVMAALSFFSPIFLLILFMMPKPRTPVEIPHTLCAKCGNKVRQTHDVCASCGNGVGV